MRTMDRKSAIFIRGVIEKAVNDALKDEKLMIRMGNVRYDSMSAGMRITVEVPEAKAKSMESQGKLKIGQTFNKPTPGGAQRIYEITDYVPRRWKYPYTARQWRNGTSYKFSEAQILRCLS